MRSCSIRSTIVSLKHWHSRAIWYLRVWIKIVLECDIVKESLEIISLLSTNHIVSCCLLFKRERFTSNSCCEHTNSVSTRTIAYLRWTITTCASWSWDTGYVRIFENHCVIIYLVSISQSYTSFVISKEHITILDSLMASRHVGHKTNLTCITNTSFCSKALLSIKFFIHKGNFTRPSCILNKRIRIYQTTFCCGEDKTFSLRALDKVIAHIYFDIRRSEINFKVLLISCNIINHHSLEKFFNLNNIINIFLSSLKWW